MVKFPPDRQTWERLAFLMFAFEYPEAVDETVMLASATRAKLL
jgi:hypothetical protein